MTVGPHKIESSTGPTSDDASFSRAPGGPASELAMRVWASARDAESSGTARESELCATERIKKRAAIVKVAQQRGSCCIAFKTSRFCDKKCELAARLVRVRLNSDSEKRDFLARRACFELKVSI